MCVDTFMIVGGKVTKWNYFFRIITSQHYKRFALLVYILVQLLFTTQCICYMLVYVYNICILYIELVVAICCISNVVVYLNNTTALNNKKGKSYQKLCIYEFSSKLCNISFESSRFADHFRWPTMFCTNVYFAQYLNLLFKIIKFLFILNRKMYITTISSSHKFCIWFDATNCLII
jgi:hypothetical protein